MKKAIQRVIDDVPSGCVFDSHFIIARLIKDKKYRASEKLTIAIVHGNIANMLYSFEKKKLITRMEFDSYSENITGKASICSCWKKN